MRIIKGLHDRIIEYAMVFKRDVSYMPRLKNRKPILCYIGWVGYGNLGDELLFQAHEALFPGHTLIPSQRKSLLGFLLRHKKKLVAGCILGGGTLISLPGDWLLNVDYFLEAGLPIFAIGTGVNFKFDARGKVTPYPNLENWANVLRRFDYVGLRGPLSAQAMAPFLDKEHFEVVGDTAMALAPPHMSALPKGKKQTVGICIGHSKDIPVPVNPENYLADCVDLVKRLLAQDLQVTLLPVWAKDEAFNEALLKQVNDNRCKLVVAYERYEDYLREVEKCSAFIGQKLHGTVMATMMRVPSLMIAYHPKCFDYMESIGMGAYCVRMESLDASKVAESCQHLLEKAPAIRAQLDATMKHYRGRLRSQASDLTKNITGSRL